MDLADPVIDLWTFDVGTDAPTAQEYAALVIDRTLQSWRDGADFVLWPEYLWAGLERYLPAGRRALSDVAKLFWESLWPGILASLTRTGKAVVLGSVPASEGVTIKNRAPIILSGKPIFQDKLHLTPWEHEFTPGSQLHLFQHAGARCAVVICLDIEIPEIASALRGQNLDLILVPSATETTLGCERIARCASGRAVELGCAVVVSHLVGRTNTSNLIDENIGRLATFLPSQGLLSSHQREFLGPLNETGFHRHRFSVPLQLLTKLGQTTDETNPALCHSRTDLKVEGA